MRSCVDCKWHHTDPNDIQPPLCKIETPDRVTGTLQYLQCFARRYDAADGCGPEGLLYEEKEPNDNEGTEE